MKKLFLFSFLILFFAVRSLAQDKTIDSLKLALKNAKHDTTSCNILNAMIEAESDDAIWPKYNEQLISLSEYNIKSINEYDPLLVFYKKKLADALDNKSYLAIQEGNNLTGIEDCNKSLKIKAEINDKAGIATSLNNLGVIFNNQGDVSTALEYFHKGLKIFEDLKDEESTANALHNIGIIYFNQGDVVKALEYHKKNLKIYEKLNYKEGVVVSLNAIARVYNHKNDYSNALTYFNKSLKLLEETGDKKGLSICLSNIGTIYGSMGNGPKALDYLIKSLKIHKEINHRIGISSTLCNIGQQYLQQKNYISAEKYGNEALAISQEIGYPEATANAAKLLHEAYYANGNYKKALENYELHIIMRDSINNIQTQKASIKQQAKYDYEQQKAVADAKHKLEMRQQDERAIAEKNKRNIIIGSVSLVLLLAVVFSFFLYKRFKLTQQQKNIIELKEKETQQQNEIITIQKHLVEEKHKEITDSINYAERIQRSFLATEKQLTENLNDYFVLFKPKDVVSGDFYWSAKLSNGNFALATADSTGHGVPGAIMSLLNVTSLEKAIEHYSNPADILNHTRQTIIERLKKDGSEEGGKDGMDCSLLAFDFTNKQLHIAAANNPVWIIRNNELIEIKPDKMPVGKSERQNESFTLHTIELQKGDTIYTLTDGFPDQFGGDKGKKFMSKKLKELLLANIHLSIPQQKELLDSTFKNWVGDLEQVDDVCVIGIRL